MRTDSENYVPLRWVKLIGLVVHHQLNIDIRVLLDVGFSIIGLIVSLPVLCLLLIVGWFYTRSPVFRLFWYPVQENRTALIAISFALGFAVDLFSDTMALHSAASVTAAFFRFPIMRFVFGVNLEFQNFRISGATRVQQFSFLALLIGVHHLAFFALEIFSLSNLLLILKRIVLTGVSTFVFSILIAALFVRRRT